MVMTNFLTVDLEDYFMVSAFDAVIKREHWDSYKSRIEQNTYRILDILSEMPHSEYQHNGSSATSHISSLHLPHNSLRSASQGKKATFFCLGWIAERYPHLIREIQSRGHEIACHSYDHRLIYRMTPEEFREDIRKSKQILEGITGKEVIGYRAPSYSITKRSLWAFEILAEEGYLYDSSVFPIHHDRYGIPDAPRVPFFVDLSRGSDIRFVPFTDFPNSAAPSFYHSSEKENNKLSSSGTSQIPPEGSNSLIEFPLSTIRFFGQNIPISGGGYFRIYPLRLTLRALRTINEVEGSNFVFYIHPWEIDREQPRVPGISVLSRFRHYFNLDKSEDRLRRLVKSFRFSPFGEALVKTRDDSRGPTDNEC